MGTDDTIARLKVLAARLERIRRQSRDVYEVAADEVRSAHTSERQRGVASRAENWKMPAGDDSLGNL